MTSPGAEVNRKAELGPRVEFRSEQAGFSPFSHLIVLFRGEHHVIEGLPVPIMQSNAVLPA